MKRILLVVFILLTGCTMEDYTLPNDTVNDTIPESEVISFEDISQEWVDTYGEPEDVYEFSSSGYYSVDYWWWTQGFAVGFVWNDWDDIYGWYVDWTYSFNPII